MDDRGTQVSLTEIVSWFDIGTMQEDEQTVPVLSIPAQEDRCLGSSQGAFEQLIATSLDLSNLSEELRWRELASLVMKMDG